MRIAVWVSLGWLGIIVTCALATRLPSAHLLPDVAVIVVAFLAMRTGVKQAVFVAAGLGYAIDAMVTSPAGLHQGALCLAAVLVRLVSGHLGGTGSVHFGLVTGFAQLSYHCLLVALLAWAGRPIGFVSWPASFLLPGAALTALLGMACFARLEALHRLLAPNVRRGLGWR